PRAHGRVAFDRRPSLGGCVPPAALVFHDGSSSDAVWKDGGDGPGGPHRQSPSLEPSPGSGGGGPSMGRNDRDRGGIGSAPSLDHARRRGAHSGGWVVGKIFGPGRVRELGVGKISIVSSISRFLCPQNLDFTVSPFHRFTVSSFQPSPMN